VLRGNISGVSVRTHFSFGGFCTQALRMDVV